MNTNKKLSIALIISLIFNLFLLGVGTGVWYSKQHPKGGFHHAFNHPPKDLSPEIKEHFKQRHQTMRQTMKEVRKIKKELHLAMTEKELDTVKIQRLFDEMNNLKQKNMSVSQQALLKALEQMSFEERLTFVENMPMRISPRHR